MLTNLGSEKNKSQTPQDQEGSKETGTVDTPIDHTAAVQRHKENVDALDRLVKQGVESEGKGTDEMGRLWPNSAKWIRAGKTALHALTPTHDSPQRVSALGKEGVARFGIDVPVPDGGDYNVNQVKDRHNIDVQPANFTGYRSAGRIAIVDAARRDAEDVKGTIVHEVQHDADHHQEKSVHEKYRTEFRAFWLSGKYDHFSDETGTGGTGPVVIEKHPVRMDNERQRQICEHLAKSYVESFWDGDQSLRALAERMTRPMGINVVNSPRVDDLYLELRKEKPSSSRIGKLCKGLTKEEKEEIRGPGMHDAWYGTLEEMYVHGKFPAGAIRKLASELEWEELNEITHEKRVKHELERDTKKRMNARNY